MFLTNRYLTFQQGTYESGSFQQRFFFLHKVFTLEGSPNNESTWIVLPLTITEEEAGYEVRFEDSIRPKHVTDRANLHSHEIESTVSGQQEVSCFDDDDSTNENDVWRVEQYDQDDEQYDDFWRVNQPVILRHVATVIMLLNLILKPDLYKFQITVDEFYTGLSAKKRIEQLYGIFCLSQTLEHRYGPWRDNEFLDNRIKEGDSIDLMVDPVHSQSIKIYCKSDNRLERLTVYINPTNTVGQLKASLSPTLNIPTENQTIKYNEETLENYKTLSEYNIAPLSLIQVEYTHNK
ncbi:hypothetical protein INT47_000825 [Mucor saturninus]|uniref:Ubiquitin-like domain-containing protein n=1 Tax=Mucor saturninus TaxID=64648 RepID=A0A8H7VH29_9FUNG|nr:hypothetical protein INT47_000825 [Mucor saturninus]